MGVTRREVDRAWGVGLDRLV